MLTTNPSLSHITFSSLLIKHQKLNEKTQIRAHPATYRSQSDPYLDTYLPNLIYRPDRRKQTQAMSASKCAHHSIYIHLNNYIFYVMYLKITPKVAKNVFELKLSFIDKDDICASFQCHEHFVQTEHINLIRASINQYKMTLLNHTRHARLFRRNSGSKSKPSCGLSIQWRWQWEYLQWWSCLFPW